MTEEGVAAMNAALSGEPLAPPAPPVSLSFDVYWIDSDRRALLFPNITGSAVEDGLLRLYGPDGSAHIINLSQVSHIHILEEDHE